ncbi:3'(2'),5'-bisphosphate nucleotidase [hydrothermal vent metagenome]|uniref:3'-phosphoadenosine 5'-phosphate phosphatase n=1 Tax=hydrothermal vent metagenome TaxID=652676 RepID=A0A3B1CQZ8_9ZZZZ
MNIHEYTINLIVSLLATKVAGDAILEVYDRDFGIEHKDDGSPLTLADRCSHEIIFDHLTSLPPEQLPVLSEEGKDIPYEERRTRDYYWLVDPLDGTKEFIKRNGEFTVNIALIHKDRPVLGVIYIPVKDTFYFAAEGLGTYKLEGSEKVGNLELREEKNNEKVIKDLLSDILRDSTRLPVMPSAGHRSGITIIGSRSHVTKEFEEFVDKMRKKYAEIEFISAGSSLKFCLVAEGKADIYPRFGPTMEWDTAAGQAIVEQAGGAVLDVETRKRMSYNKENLLNHWFIASLNSSIVYDI